MEHALFIAELNESADLYVSELSHAALRENGMEPSGGLFLYESVDRVESPGIRILAQVPDVEAAYRLAEVFTQSKPVRA